jgi:hypothetical protein
MPSSDRAELKALNVFGLSMCRFARLWGAVSTVPGRKDDLAIFPTKEASIHAAIDNIRFNYLFLGFFIPANFGNRWSGDSLKKYGKNLSALIYLVPWMPYHFKFFGDRLLRGIAIMENGDPCRGIQAGYFQQFIDGDA